MKQSKLFHPRVFNDQEWAEGYYKRNKKSIEKVGKRLVGILADSGFTNGKLLDVGCGFARIAIEIAKRFPEVEITGIDLGEPLLDIGRKLISEHGFENQITLNIGDAHQLNFEDNSYDIVINSFMLHIVEDPVSMLNEIERVAKPDASIIMTDLRRGFLAYFVKKFKTAYTLDEALLVIQKSDIRPGVSSTGPFWWDYIAIDKTFYK